MCGWCRGVDMILIETLEQWRKDIERSLCAQTEYIHKLSRQIDDLKKKIEELENDGEYEFKITKRIK
jgi:phage shock protein A